MDSHDVLSAFLDNEPFDANELARALADPEGRDLLLDLVALRGIVSADADASGPAPALGRRRTWWALGAVAAVAAVIVLVATLVVPARRAPGASASDRPPAPDRVVKFERGVDWHETR